MKKKIVCFLFLIAGFAWPAFAAAGYANDGLEFLLVLAGFLLVLAGILEGIELLVRKRKNILHCLTGFFHSW